jgi:hypothetical protein
MKIIAAIEDPQVIKKILSHLGLPTKAPAVYPARGPPVASDEIAKLRADVMVFVASRAHLRLETQSLRRIIRKTRKSLVQDQLNP